MSAGDNPPTARLLNLRARLDKAETELCEANAALREILVAAATEDDGLLAATARATDALVNLNDAQMKYQAAGGQL